MNQKDRERMGRLYSAVSHWPWPNRLRTLGLVELSEFFSNMEELQPIFMSAIMAVSSCDDPAQKPEEELYDLETTLARMRGA